MEDRVFSYRMRTYTEEQLKRDPDLLKKIDEQVEMENNKRMNPKTELTEAQKLLIRGLRLFDLTEEEQEEVFLLLRTKDQQWELLDFLCEHKTATREEVLKETVRILKKS